MGSTATPAPKEVKEVPVTRTVFDLDTFESVLLAKDVESLLAPVAGITSVDDAVLMLNNDAKELLDVIRIGMRTKIRNAAADNPDIPWMVTDDNGKITANVFSGTVADNGEVNRLRLNLAKSIYAPLIGGWDALSNEQKAECKDKAMKYIQNSNEIKTGLQAQAKLAQTSE